jgi:hypothetical protein
MDCNALNYQKVHLRKSQAYNQQQKTWCGSRRWKVQDLTFIVPDKITAHLSWSQQTNNSQGYCSLRLWVKEYRFRSKVTYM